MMIRKRLFSALDGDQLDLHHRVFRQLRDRDCAARRFVVAEVFGVDAVQDFKVRELLQKYGRFHYVGKRSACSFEHTAEILEDAAGVHGEITFDQFSALRVERDLSRGEDELFGGDSLRVRTDCFGSLFAGNELHVASNRVAQYSAAN